MNYCINIDYHYFCMHIMYSYSITGTELNILYWSETSMNKTQQNKLKYKQKSFAVLWHSTAAFLLFAYVYFHISVLFLLINFISHLAQKWPSNIAEQSSEFLNSVSPVDTHEKLWWAIQFSGQILKQKSSVRNICWNTFCSLLTGKNSLHS